MQAALEELVPESPAELARLLSSNWSGERNALLPVGGRTSLRCGHPVIETARPVSTAALNKVIDYPARDQTITVGAGMRIADLQKILVGERQRLPIDVPEAHRATVGGAIAANASGPGRFGHGTFRDFLIGVSGVDGRGRLFSAGGRVVKNVAGYDLCKLLVGSLGTLAVISEATFKLRPLPEERISLWAAFSTLAAVESALEKFAHSATRPVAIELLNQSAATAISAEAKQQLPPGYWLLGIVFEGSTRECEWQTATAMSELQDAGPTAIEQLASKSTEAIWSALVEFPAASGSPGTFVAAVPPSALARLVDQATQQNVDLVAHAGNGVLIGHLPDACVSADAARNLIAALRKTAIDASGHLTVWNSDASWNLTADLDGAPPSAAPWMKSVKAALDPANLLSPNRLPFVMA
jgi:glycolate oxidase FAD binding subunit